ncbi:MAG: hypothetical protein R2729_02590 [Bryobacteraceae bacterium]
MHCLLCGKKLPFLRKLKNGDFCSAAHQEEFQREQNQAAVSRLLAAANVEEKSAAAAAKRRAVATPPPDAPAESAPAQAKAKPVQTGSRSGRKASQPADAPAQAVQTFFPYAFSWIEWTGKMQLPAPRPTRPRYRLVVPALVRKSRGRRAPVQRAGPVTLPFWAETDEGGLSGLRPAAEQRASAELDFLGGDPLRQLYAAFRTGLLPLAFAWDGRSEPSVPPPSASPEMPEKVTVRPKRVAVRATPRRAEPPAEAIPELPAEPVTTSPLPETIAAPAAAETPAPPVELVPEAAASAVEEQSAPAPDAGGDLAIGTGWPEGWTRLHSGDLGLRPLWALPVTQRPDWRPKHLPALAVQLQNDPGSDPYTAAQQEGSGALPIGPPALRRPGLDNTNLRASKDTHSPLEPRRESRLPASRPEHPTGLSFGRLTTVGLAEPPAGSYPWIKLFPRPIDLQPRFRGPRTSRRSGELALPWGGRTAVPLPSPGANAGAVWLTSPPEDLRPPAPRVPAVGLRGGHFGEPFRIQFPIGVHPKTRLGTEVLPGSLDVPEELPAPAVRRARLAAALHNDWLTIAAGPVPMVLEVNPRPMAGEISRPAADPAEDVTARPQAPESALAPNASASLRRPKHRMLPISLDEAQPADWRAACRYESDVTPDMQTAPLRPSGLATVCPEVQVASPSKFLWQYRLQRVAGQWQSMPAPIRWSGPLMALVAAFFLVGPGSSGVGMVSGSNPASGGAADAGVETAVMEPEPAGPARAGRNAAKPERAASPAGDASGAVVPTVPASTGGGIWDTVRQRITERAAVALTDDFRNGLSAWAGSGNWARKWSYDAAGFVRTGPLALYTPSTGLADYRAEFLGQIERRSLGWVLRARDLRNYYACKLVISGGGPMPKVSLVRYRVVNGATGPVHTKELPMQVQADTVYRVLSEVRGNSFTVSVQGMIVDAWDEERLPIGGVGFFSGGGELARIRWVGVWHQYDILGRLCAFLAPAGLKTNRNL